MAPKENKKPKEVSSVNQRTNPSTGQKRRAGPPEGGRDPKQMKPLSPEELQAQKVLNNQRVTINAEKELRNFLNSPRGKDHPGGIVKHWARQRPVRLVVRPLPTEGEPNPKPYVLIGPKGRYSIHSNAPGFRLREGDSIFHIRSENILHTQGQIVFAENTYPATFTDPVSLEKAFAAQHWTAGLAEQDAALLIKWGSVEGDDKRSEEEKLGGLDCISFKTQGDFWLDFKDKDESTSKKLKDLVKDLNKGSHVITLVWKKRDVKKSVQQYWLHRMEKAVLEGVWSYYKDQIGKVEGQLFFQWQNTPDKEIKHQLWMEILDLKKAKSEIKRFASQALKRSFGSMRELEIVECIALIYETMYENQIIRMYFDNDKYHEARVLDNINGYVQLGVKVSRQDDYTMPQVVADSRFQLRKVQLNDPDLVMTEDDKEDPIGEGLFSALPKQESAPQATPTYSHSGAEYSARSINVDHDGDFAASFFIKEKKERAEFVKGQQITVALKMVRNPIPTRRQLKAISKVCKKPSKKDSWRQAALQRYLKGAGDPETDEETLGSVKEEAFKRMTDREKELFEAYVASCNMNTPQEEVWKRIFNYRHFLTQLQGPPGTGKTRTVATIALSFALLKVRTALCAPSNTATEECMKNVIEQLNLLYLIDPTARDDFLVVFLPTTASTKASLANLSEEQAANDFVAEGQGSANDPFKEYRLHAHIIRSFQTRVNTGQGDVETARKWLDVLAKLKSRASVSRKDLRAFVDLGIAESERILKDQKVRIVVSTSNNSALMAEYGYKVDALVIDEAAFATEQDSMVPLSLGARCNVIVGDHEQLKPFVRSRGHNEFARQLGLSIYERFYGHCNVPLFRLKINYRMHPDIAELPGMLTYEWLGCDDCTSKPSDAYQFFEDWYNNSDLGNEYQQNTREPEFGGTADEGIRVRWINPIGGKASAKPGSTSLRNFANINVAVDLVLSLLMHQPSEGVPDIVGSDISIISLYKGDLDEMSKQLKWAVNGVLPGFLNIPECTTVDKFQGGQNEIIILLVPPHHCNLLGFLKEWNRLNVSFTRAKSGLYIVGPLDALRAQLKVIAKGMKCKKLALTLIDFLEKGRVIDAEGFHRLPASAEEGDMKRELWSQVQNDPSAKDLKLKDAHQKLQNSYDEDEQKRFELELLAELKERRAKATDLRGRFERGEQFDLPLKTNVQDEGDDDDHVDDDEDFTPEAVAKDDAGDDEEDPAQGPRSPDRD